MFLGQRCQIVGVKSREELNLACCRAISYDRKTGRYGVELEGTLERVALRPANLAVVSREPALLAIAATAGLSLACRIDGQSVWQFRAEDAVPRNPPNQPPPTMPHTPPAPSLEIRTAGAAGLGVFALRAIAPGERIAAEAPLLQWSKERDGDDIAALEAAVGRLGAQARHAFWDLCQNDEHGPRRAVYGTWLSNALPTTSGTAAVFRLLSRVNHSCKPNAHAAWSPALRAETLHALSPIAAGEEVRRRQKDAIPERRRATTTTLTLFSSAVSFALALLP